MESVNINKFAGQQTREVVHYLNDRITTLNDRITTLENYLEWDIELRKHSPALQDLYEKFQETRKLISK